MTSDPERRQTVLIVDDMPANVRLLSDILTGAGYGVTMAHNGRAALTLIAGEAPDLVLLDVNMPDMNGYEVCEALKSDPALTDIPVIFISGIDDPRGKVRAFEAGGVDYITKPFDGHEVRARVQAHIRLRLYQHQLELHNKNLGELVSQQVTEIRAQQREITLAHFATIRALSKLAESRDDDTGKHVDRVQEYCRALAATLGESDSSESAAVRELADVLWNAAPLHDIGKVAVPDAILRKPEKLTPEEFREMQMHTVVGAETLQTVRAVHPANALVNAGIAIARSHHERWDGAGYPDGLSAKAIPLAARCVAIADVYDALRSRRTYKEPLPHAESRQIIADGRGTQFDAELVDAFLRCEAEFEAIHEALGA